MADEQPINIPIQVTGFEEASSELTQLAKRITDLEKATGSAKPKIADAGKAMDQKAVNAAKLSTVMGSLSPIVGRVSTETAKLTQVFSTAGSTVTGLTSVVGGPFGLALGAAVAATGLLVTAMGEAEAAADRERDAIEKATLSLDDYIEAAAKARQADDLRRATETNRGNVDQQQGKINQREADLNALRERRGQIEQFLARAEAANNPILATRIQAAREQLQATNDNIAATQAALDGARQGLIFAQQEEQEKEAIEGKVAARHEAARARAKELREWTSAQQGMFEAAMLEGTGGRGPVPTSFDPDARSIDSLMRDATGGSTANDNAVSDDALDAFVDNEVAKAQAAEAAAARISSAYDSAFGVVADAGVNAFAAIVTGQDVAVGALLAGVGQQLAAQGLKHVFEGGARSIASFGTDPSGPALIGIGGAEIAAGAAMGAVGNAMSAPSSSGSSGPQKPVDQMQSGNEGGGQNVTIIQNNVVPDAYAGERIRDALRRDGYRRGKVAA